MLDLLLSNSSLISSVMSSGEDYWEEYRRILIGLQSSPVLSLDDDFL